MENESKPALFESVGGPLKGGGKYAVAAKQAMSIDGQVIPVGAMPLDDVPGKGKGIRRPGNTAMGENLYVLFAHLPPSF